MGLTGNVGDGMQARSPCTSRPGPETAYAAEDYRLLRAVKKAYDPDNFFCINHNIPPAGSRRAEPVVG